MFKVIFFLFLVTTSLLTLGQPFCFKKGSHLVQLAKLDRENNFYELSIQNIKTPNNFQITYHCYQESKNKTYCGGHDDQGGFELKKDRIIIKGHLIFGSPDGPNISLKWPNNSIIELEQCLQTSANDLVISL